VIYKGGPPLDIEKSVIYPIEKAVSSASNVEHVESFSKQGIGAVQIWFNWGADINVGQMEVMQRITQILNSLPPAIMQPFVVKFDVSNIPVAFVTVSGGNLDERALYDMAFNTIAPQIEQIANVAAATVEGGKVRQIKTITLPRDGQRAVYLRVNKQPAANTVEVVRLLRRALPEMVGIPPGVQLGVSFDQSVFIRLAIQNLMEQALEGSVLAAAIIL